MENLYVVPEGTSKAEAELLRRQAIITQAMGQHHGRVVRLLCMLVEKGFLTTVEAITIFDGEEPLVEKELGT